MSSILDDEFVVQLDDSPPFSWINQFPTRLMHCNALSTGSKLSVHASGNALTSVLTLKDLVEERDLIVDKKYMRYEGREDIVISNSGENARCIDFVRKSESLGTAITSGGTLKHIANEKGWNVISLPKGFPSRYLFPEIVGCVSSILGLEPYSPDMDAFAEMLAPSTITDENIAKQLAITVVNNRVLLIHDDNSGGIARKFFESFLQTTGILIPIIDKEQYKFFGENTPSGTLIIPLTNDLLLETQWSKLAELIKERSIQNYVKAAMLIDLSSLYASILLNKEFQLVDYTIE